MNACGCVSPRPGCSCGYTGPQSLPVGSYKGLNDIADLMRRVEWLEKLLTQRFSRSSGIEEELIAIGVGKRDLPTREECREWGLKLGIPDEFRTKESK